MKNFKALKVNPIVLRVKVKDKINSMLLKHPLAPERTRGKTPSMETLSISAICYAFLSYNQSQSNLFPLTQKNRKNKSIYINPFNSLIFFQAWTKWLFFFFFTHPSILTFTIVVPHICGTKCLIFMDTMKADFESSS